MRSKSHYFWSVLFSFFGFFSFSLLVDVFPRVFFLGKILVLIVLRWGFLRIFDRLGERRRQPMGFLGDREREGKAEGN